MVACDLVFCQYERALRFPGERDLHAGGGVKYHRSALIRLKSVSWKNPPLNTAQIKMCSTSVETFMKTSTAVTSIIRVDPSLHTHNHAKYVLNVKVQHPKVE